MGLREATNTRSYKDTHTVIRELTDEIDRCKALADYYRAGSDPDTNRAATEDLKAAAYDLALCYYRTEYQILLQD